MRWRRPPAHRNDAFGFGEMKAHLHLSDKQSIYIYIFDLLSLVLHPGRDPLGLCFPRPIETLGAVRFELYFSFLGFYLNPDLFFFVYETSTAQHSVCQEGRTAQHMQDRIELNETLGLLGRHRTPSCIACMYCRRRYTDRCPPLALASEVSTISCSVPFPFHPALASNTNGLMRNVTVVCDDRQTGRDR